MADTGAATGAAVGAVVEPQEAPQPLRPSLFGRHRDRLERWIKILGAYFSAQGLTQLLGMLAGLIFVNFMPVREFALYTLAYSVVAFFHFVTDLGSTGSLIYFFNLSRREGTEFGSYLAAVVSLRRRVFVAGGVVVVAAFPLVATREGFATGPVWMAAAGILGCVWFQISSAIRVLALRLGDHYPRSYRAEIAGGGVRLLSAAAMAATSYLPAWLGVSSGAVAAATTARLAREPHPRPKLDTAALAPARRQVLRYLLPTLPAALYYSIQGPLVVWLAATFGGVQNVAEVGALGRLGLILGVFSGLTGVVYLPRLAQIVDPRHYRRRALQYAASLLGVAVAMQAMALVAPRLFLLLLGDSYADLELELQLVVAGAGLTLLAGFFVGINSARSWNRWQGVAVGVLVASQAVLVAVLPLQTTQGLVLFNLLSTAVGFGLQLFTAAVGFARPAWVHW